MTVALWHLPLVTSGMLAPFGLPVTFAITLVYVWLVNRAGGSALVAVVFHVTQRAIGAAALGFTGADADRLGRLTGVLWCLIAVGVVTFDRPARRSPGQARIRRSVDVPA
ncbi:hypothetical protein [Amycolatopsis camponoti]|uniref:hypothetical protein n=1 Tax=Amycolatopsis camponoti TaxID=2606593 RepID=UPI0012D7F22E|nr:hypothetical protein [Amycolatopsis camponoti]